MKPAGKAAPARRSLLAAVAAIALFAVGQAAADVDNGTLANEADGKDWGAYGRTFSEQRFSPLDQINKGNVKQLGLAWDLELPDVWNV
jgi:quinohemoprotein ethanol dehydrogenase